MADHTRKEVGKNMEMEPVVEDRLRDLQAEMEKKIRCYLKLCESPIERLVLLEFIKFSFTSLTFTLNDEPGRPTIMDDYDIELTPHPDGLCWDEAFCDKKRYCRFIPQFRVEVPPNRKFRIDFALFYPRSDGKGLVKVAIECDGHEFHEKTKEQARRDKEKDRLLQEQGWLIARFTGSEIYEDPFNVYDKITHLAGIKDYQLGTESEGEE